MLSLCSFGTTSVEDTPGSVQLVCPQFQRRIGVEQRLAIAAILSQQGKRVAGFRPLSDKRAPLSSNP